jgi:hypothetical protein
MAALSGGDLGVAMGTEEVVQSIESGRNREQRIECKEESQEARADATES